MAKWSSQSSSVMPLNTAAIVTATGEAWTGDAMGIPRAHDAGPSCVASSGAAVQPHRPRLARHGKIAKARAGNPRPCFTFGQVTTISAPFGGTLSRLAITSI